MKRPFVLLPILILLVSNFAFSQDSPSAEDARGQLLSSRAVVSLITIQPGEALYSAFGHTAIRIEDPVRKIDELYNYGQSEVPFDAAFVPKFVTGNMWFVLGVTDTKWAFRFYRMYEDRTILSQKLNLSPRQKNELYTRLVENALPENRSYIYDFFDDNCATRVRDILEDVAGKDLFTGTERPATTYREEIAPYLKGQPLLKSGIDLLLGPNTDRTADERGVLFLPERLREAVSRATVGGSSVPLAGKTEVIYRSSREAAADPGLWYLVPFWAVFALALLLSVFSLRGGKAGRIFDRIILGAAGVVGIILLFLWLFSGYRATFYNLNLLWAWPLHLAALALVRKPSTARSGGKGTAIETAAAVYFGASAAASGLFVLSLPFIPQEIPQAVIPLVLTVCLRSAVRSAAAARRLRSDGAGEMKPLAEQS